MLKIGLKKENQKIKKSLNNSFHQISKSSEIKEIEENEEVPKKRIIQTEILCKSESKRNLFKTTNIETKNPIKMYKTYKDTNISLCSSTSSTSIQMKYIESITKCTTCNEYMNHRLPCGCLVCFGCSKKKILLFHQDNNIKIPLSVCSCGYILNDKDKKIITKN